MAADFFTFLPGLPRPSQKGKFWRQYELGVYFSRTLCGPFVFNANFWDIPYFLVDFTCLLTTTSSRLSNSLMRLPLLSSSLCLSLLSYTSTSNSSLCLNRCGYAASKLFKAWCPSEVTSLDLSGDSSIGNENSLFMATTDKLMSVPSTGPAFQAYNSNHTPWNHWWSLPLSVEFIFCTLFKYLWKLSFIIALCFPLSTSCTRIIKLPWKVLSEPVRDEISGMNPLCW